MSGPDHDDADPRPWEGPGALRRDVEPHRGATLRLLGGAGAALGTLAVPCAAAGGCSLLASLLAGAFLVLSWVLSAGVLWASRTDLALIRRGAMDPAGTRQTEAAWALALFGLFAVLLAGLILAVVELI
jgi:hypothetical protein